MSTIMSTRNPPVQRNGPGGEAAQLARAAVARIAEANTATLEDGEANPTAVLQACTHVLADRRRRFYTANTMRQAISRLEGLAGRTDNIGADALAVLEQLARGRRPEPQP